MNDGCNSCGLMVNSSCFVSGAEVGPEKRKFFNGCAYFIKGIFEDGEPLKPEQLLLLVENEIRTKR